MSKTIPWKLVGDGSVIRRDFDDVSIWLEQSKGCWIIEASTELKNIFVGHEHSCPEAIQTACDWARENGHL